jgi:hypothetical protein
MVVVAGAVAISAIAREIANVAVAGIRTPAFADMPRVIAEVPVSGAAVVPPMERDNPRLAPPVALAVSAMLRLNES